MTIEVSGAELQTLCDVALGAGVVKISLAGQTVKLGFRKIIGVTASVTLVPQPDGTLCLDLGEIHAAGLNWGWAVRKAIRAEIGRLLAPWPHIGILDHDGDDYLKISHWRFREVGSDGATLKIVMEN